MKPTELIAFLKEHDRHLKKSLGQNFLIDENILRKIIHSASIQPNDTVLEIGPGAGALTSLLLEKAKVIAVEKDDFFADKLKRLSGNLTVYQQDILKFDLSVLPKNVKVVANLPYNITTPILSSLIEHHEHFDSLVIMVQKEVGERITAKPKSKAYGSLSIFLQFYSDVSYEFTVSRNCFLPKPKIDSAIIKLTLKTPPLKDPAPFFKVVRKAFEKRRKMLSSSLKEFLTKEEIENALKALQLNPKARPEDLSLDQWLRFYQAIK